MLSSRFLRVTNTSRHIVPLYNTSNTNTKYSAASFLGMTTAAVLLSTSAFAESPLHPAEWRAFKVRAVEKVSHNTSKISFELPQGKSLEMPIASCVVIKAPGVDDGKDAVRPYTPVTTNRDLGHFDFVVKRYPNGKGSVFLTDVKVGDSVEFKGPYAKIQYSPNFKKKVGMLAGGTGITPMLQILLEALSNPEDKTEYTLLFGNVSEADILLKDQLDDLAKKHSNFKVHYVLDKAPQGWTGSVGFIGADLIKKFMPEPSDDNIVLVCGPPPMVKSISGPKKSAAEQGELTGILKDLHYTESQVFKF